MYKFLKIRCLNFYSAFQIECIVTEIFSVEFEFVKVNHDCTLTSVLFLQYKYVLYINYIYIYINYTILDFFLLSKIWSKCTSKHNKLHLATIISLFVEKLYNLYYKINHIILSRCP